MPNINQKKVKSFDYTKPETLKEHERYVESLVTFDDVRHAYELFKNLPKIFEDSKSELGSRYDEVVAQYQIIISQARAVALPLLSNTEVVDLLRTDYVGVANTVGDVLLDKLEAKIISHFFPEDRDVYKKRLRQSLALNEQLLTENSIQSSTGERKPTVVNWIKDYTSSVGVGPADEVVMAEYLTQSSAISGLQSEADRDAVRLLVKVYEALKLSSLTMEGAEQPISVRDGDVHKVLRHGRLEDVPREDETVQKVLLWMDKKGLLDKKVWGKSVDKIKKRKRLVGHRLVSIDSVEKDDSTKMNQNTAQTMSEPLPAPTSKPDPAKPDVASQIQAAYAGDPKILTAIDTAVEKINKVSTGEPEKIRQEFYRAVQNKDFVRTFATLRLLIEADDLINFMSVDARLQKFLTVTWEKQYGSGTVQAYKKEPSSPRFIVMFLRYVLEDRLGQSKAKAAWSGARLGNLMAARGHPEYAGLAYYDMEAGEFRWQS